MRFLIDLELFVRCQRAYPRMSAVYSQEMAPFGRECEGRDSERRARGRARQRETLE